MFLTRFVVRRRLAYGASQAAQAPNGLWCLLVVPVTQDRIVEASGGALVDPVALAEEELSISAGVSVTRFP
jgi:hypothetical protein